ncbi:Pectin lyase-like superfamily protein [Perilla frutescens var. hirtella]|nr:Pectin lyase-like superfamily protein [Perilla frutescens var. hirtella]
MKELKSASPPDAFTFCFKYYFLHITIYFISNIAKSNGFDPLIQLPSSGLSRNTYSSSSPKTLVLNIDKFGAKGDGITDDSKILQDVWKVACFTSSPAEILIPSGNSYLVNPTSFGGPCQSNVTLRISGTIVAPRDPEVWDAFDVLKWLYFHGVNHLTVEGGGIINGMGQKWWDQSCKTNISNPCTHAPRAVTFHKCNSLKIRHITLVNSQQMHMAFTNCRHVAASHLRVIAPSHSPNTDGIHISESTHVQLKDATISTGDDCVSIVSNSSRISINNIICGPGHGISIGSLGKLNSSDKVHDIVVNGVTLFDTENGVRIKTWQGGSGYARKIVFENIQMHNVSNPIIIDQYYCDSPVPCPNQTSAVRIDSISFRNIKGTSATEEAITLSCSESHPCKRLYLKDIQLTSLSGTAKSFCWEAYGTSSGQVQPPSCLSSTGTISQQNIKSQSTSLQRDDHAFI